MSKLYKRKRSPFYYGKIRGYRFSTGTTKKLEAERVLRQKEHELWSRQHNLVDNTNKPAQEFFTKYLEWVKLNKRYHTFRSYNTIIKCFCAYLDSKGGIKKLKEVNNILFDEYLMHRLKKSKRWTVNNHIISLKAMFNKALEWHYIKCNPAAGQHKVEVNDSKQIVCLSEAECKAFFSACREHYLYYYPMFYAFIFTGMRSGELFHTEWSDIDFDKNLIYIRNKPGFSPKGKNLKENKAKERMIPLHPGLKDLLLNMPKESNYVFTDHGKPFSKQKPRRLLIRIAKRAGVKGLTRLHELRHSYSGLLLSKGIHIFALKELLGHSDIRETQKYSHIIPEHFKATAGILAQIDFSSEKPTIS